MCLLLLHILTKWTFQWILHPFSSISAFEHWHAICTKITIWSCPKLLDPTVLIHSSGKPNYPWEQQCATKTTVWALRNELSCIWCIDPKHLLKCWPSSFLETNVFKWKADAQWPFHVYSLPYSCQGRDPVMFQMCGTKKKVRCAVFWSLGCWLIIFLPHQVLNPSLHWAQGCVNVVLTATQCKSW